MTEEQAKALANIVGGDPWMSGGDIWVVIIHREDGNHVVLTDESIVEYSSDDPFDADAKVVSMILLQ